MSARRNADGKYRSNLSVVRILTKSPTKKSPSEFSKNCQELKRERVLKEMPGIEEDGEFKAEIEVKTAATFRL